MNGHRPPRGKKMSVAAAPKKRPNNTQKPWYWLEPSREPGICCKAKFKYGILRIICCEGRLIIVRAPYLTRPTLRYGCILALGLALVACGGLPDWSAAPDTGDSGALPDGWTFPELSQLPTPPGPPPAAAARESAVQSLEAARLQNQRAGENLSSQIESNFEYPTATSN